MTGENPVSSGSSQSASEESSLPSSNSGPLQRSELRQALERLKPGVRLQEAFAVLAVAKGSVSFAEAVVPVLRQRANDAGKNPLSGSLGMISRSLMHTAIVDAAAPFDRSGDGAKSLPNILKIVEQLIEADASIFDRDSLAALELIDGVRRVVEQGTQEIVAVRKWRNTLAAHRSHDYEVDPWGRENPPNFNTMRVALDQVGHAYADLAALIEMMPATAGLVDDSNRISDTEHLIGIPLADAAGGLGDILGDTGRIFGDAFNQATAEAFRPR